MVLCCFIPCFILTGYKDFTIDDLKNFRQLNSICAGTQNIKKNSGIETTTGPLGQGLVMLLV